MDRLARGLQKAGLVPGDVCVLMMPNSVNWVLCYYALAKLGAVVVTVNFLYRVGDLGHIFRDSGAKALLATPPTWSKPPRCLRSCPKSACASPTAGRLPASRS